MAHRNGKLKTKYLASFLLSSVSTGFALYGPDTDRAPVAIAILACQQSDFRQSHAMVLALQSQNVSDAMAVLPHALAELSKTAKTSPLYPARAFCVHELAPAVIAGDERPTPLPVARMKSIGLRYFYYEPDAAWILGANPVDLTRLATQHLDSQWGRQAFLRMTQLGWSRGSCREGPNQFYAVIQRGREYLQQYPHAEVSNGVRLATASAYATWWNLAQKPPADLQGATFAYKKGASDARLAAITLYEEYLKAGAGNLSPVDEAKQITLLQQDPKGSQSYDFFCPDYED